jgi:hypothetical protein
MPARHADKWLQYDYNPASALLTTHWHCYNAR